MSVRHAGTVCPLGAQVIDPVRGGLAGGGGRRFGGPATLVVDAVGVNATSQTRWRLPTWAAGSCLVGMGSPQLELSAYGISTQERSADRFLHL